MYGFERLGHNDYFSLDSVIPGSIVMKFKLAEIASVH